MNQTLKEWLFTFFYLGALVWGVIGFLVLVEQGNTTPTACIYTYAHGNYVCGELVNTNP